MAARLERLVSIKQKNVKFDCHHERGLERSRWLKEFCEFIRRSYLSFPFPNCHRLTSRFLGFLYIWWKRQYTKLLVCEAPREVRERSILEIALFTLTDNTNNVVVINN